MGLYDAVLDNLLHSVALMTRGMESQSTSRCAHEDSIKCLQVFVIELAVTIPYANFPAVGMGLVLPTHLISRFVSG